MYYCDFDKLSAKQRIEVLIREEVYLFHKRLMNETNWVNETGEYREFLAHLQTRLGKHTFQMLSKLEYYIEHNIDD